MLNIANYSRNANQNYNEVPPHTNQNGHHQKNLQTINAGEGVEKREPSYPVGENVNWYRFLRKLKIKLSCNPAIPLLGIYPEKVMV